jgi:indolepyruvate ferredoxin oxidoreductase alpha subunit
MGNLLLGDEAVGLAAIHAGISGVFSYPGTPATEIFEYVQQAGERNGLIAARWSANEKVAYEEALGMSYVGKRALVAMKHVGLNVAADPFMSSALTGAHAALVLAVADDPSMHSSQNEQDTRFYGDFACVPLLEPFSQQECYDMTREAFRLSEQLGLPVVIRLVTRLAHSRAVVTPAPLGEAFDTTRPRPKPQDWILMPVNARRRFRRLLDLQGEIQQWSEQSIYNQMTLRGPRGIIASGLAYAYVREAVDDGSSFSILKIGTYPLPVGRIREFVEHCEDIFVIEEGYPFIEDRLRGLLGVPGKSIRGKRSGDLPLDGELTPSSVRRALGLSAFQTRAWEDDLPDRPPALCQGCPHCDTFSALNEALDPGEEPIIFSDIGCYTLAALPPYNAVHTCVDMGASISMALGAAKAGAHPVICTIGDSTFTHSGMTPLLGAAHENANMTVLIMDNAAVGMTGAQEVLMTGAAFVRLLEGLGVDPNHIVHFEPLKKTHAENVEMIRREIRYRGLSVLVASRSCIHVKRRASDRRTDEVTACSESPPAVCRR